MTSLEGAALVGRKDHDDYSGIVFPAYWPGDPKPREFFLRRDHPDYEQRNGQLKPKSKYFAPPGRSNLLVFGPGESVEALADPTIPIVCLEGLKKIVAGSRLAHWDSETSRFLACGITGAYNFRGTIGKTTDATGARVSIKGVIADLDRVIWTRRLVFLIYDSDSATNPSVRAARETFAEELRARGARVIVLYLPMLDGLPIVGFDTLVSRWGPQAVLDWVRAAQTGAAEVQDDPDPIPLDAFELPTCPANLLPASVLRDMVEVTAQATETPVELALMMGLGAVATCVQRKFVLEVKPGYVEPLNLWPIVALESGNRKSAVVREMAAPLFAFEWEYEHANKSLIDRATAARELAEERVKSLRARAARADGANFEQLRRDFLTEDTALPDVPKLLRLTAQDVTIEKLGQLMADHGEKMAIISDEGGIFDILGGRYHNGVPNLDLFLQAYSGDVHRVDRGSRPEILLRRPALTLALSPQPSVLRGLASVPSFRGRGLMARPLLALPRSIVGYRTLGSIPISTTARQAYRDHLHALLGWHRARMTIHTP